MGEPFFQPLLPHKIIRFMDWLHLSTNVLRLGIIT
jgi:hypothetical protein